MRFVEATESIEILHDSSKVDARRRARERQALIDQSAAEEALRCYDPAGARMNDNPACSGEDY